MRPLTRRGLVGGAAAAAAALADAGQAVGGPRTAGGRAAGRAAGAAADPALPLPADSGIDHVVVVCMENRSFDHLLGWLPGADGRQAGLTYRDAGGVAHATHPLAPDFQGCGFSDPDHSAGGARVQYAGGAMDGFLRSGGSDPFAIGYYTRADLPFTGEAAAAWTACDGYFAAYLGPTFPNRLYLHAGRTDRTRDSIAISRLPTIWDRLKAAGLRGAYYTSGLPFLALWGGRYLGITRTFDRFLADCRSGKLPELSFVDPPFTLAGLLGGESTSSDDHPHGDIRAGEAWLNRVYRAVTAGPAWQRTLLVITFDEWGGFFDHVAPAAAPDVGGPQLRGFRVPTILISPRARRGHVDHGVYDHASILRLVEWRWGLAPLAPRDAAARNLALALDLAASADLSPAPAFRVPALAAGKPCP
jgi:phospholipase C